ncbi:helix-turn-helix domain-containing protein [Gaoshiqia sp. Z1-71]|uniref:helix-turn-helix domain-containing protein n=1 Tax=Gaoshiqia hydrogeniformans TaxID=3290090 RepID=UPI003BF7FD74
MEKENRIVVIGETEIGLIVEKAVQRALAKPTQTDDSFEQERLSKVQAAKFTGMSIPTLRRRVKQGIFKEHGTGRKTFFLKSEIIASLRNSNI